VNRGVTPPPDDRAASGAWLAAGLGAIGLAAVASAMIATGAAGPRLTWVAGVAYVLVMAAVLWLVTGHHVHGSFGPANHVTAARVVLTSIVLGAAVEQPNDTLAWWVIALATIACVLDGIDGWLARRTGLHSPFGARFDMEIDALLTLALSVLVWRFEKAGPWILAAGLMRYAFVTAGWFWTWLAGPLTPTRRGKAVAVLQFVGLGIALLPLLDRAVTGPIAAATLAALVWSFSVDVGRLWRAGIED
jgi:phosphatidylglycerophosphate synthase